MRVHVHAPYATAMRMRLTQATRHGGLSRRHGIPSAGMTRIRFDGYFSAAPCTSAKVD
jgi:hypothetical protein